MARVIPEIVEVEWLDSVAVNHGGWTDYTELDDIAKQGAMRHRSSGYLVRESKDAVVLATSINDQDGQENESLRMAGAFVIPKKAVLRREVLKGAEPVGS